MWWDYFVIIIISLCLYFLVYNNDNNKCAELDRLTRKQLTLYKVQHPWADVDRLYVSRKKGGKGLLSVADIVSLEKHSLSVYVMYLLLGIWDYSVHSDGNHAFQIYASVLLIISMHSTF